MNNFTWKVKTELIFGKDTVPKVGEKVASFGSKKCMIHYDKSEFIKPLVAQVADSLKAAGVEVVELPGVEPNPKFSLIMEGIKICREQNVDFIVGVGGGSTMDSTKTIAVGVNYPGKDEDLWDKVDVDVKHKAVPHAAVTTLAATGSEFSGTAMVQNDLLEYPVKKGIGGPDICFDFVIADPQLLYTLPPKQTAAGTMDIISHATESYFGDSENAYLQKGVLATVIRTAMKEGKVAMADPTNYDARGNLFLASYIATMGLHNPPFATDWAVHNIEKPLTNLYHGTHGVNLAILTLGWLKYAWERNVPLYEQWAVECMGATRDIYDPKKTVFDGIEIFENWIKAMGLPTRLSEIGIDDSRLEEAADLGLAVAGVPCGDHKVIGRCTKLTKDDIIAIYKSVL